MTGAELKTLREGLNLSAQELADILGIKAERSVRRWEDGSRAVPDDVAARVTTMDAEVERMAGMLIDMIKAQPKTRRIALVRYETAEDFGHFNHDEITTLHFHRLHNAALGRFFHTARAKGFKETRLVSMDVENYEAWRFQKGLEDEPELRADWALTQIAG